MQNDRDKLLISQTFSELKSQSENLLKLRRSEFNFSTENGISLLKERNFTFLNYLKKLFFLNLMKINGFDFDSGSGSEEEMGQNVIWSMVKDRFLIEKSSQLKLKMKYQIDKLVKAANLTDNHNDRVDAFDPSNPISIEDVDPLAFKPNPSALALNTTSLEEAGENSQEQGDGIYRPPRLAPMHYDDSAKSIKSTKLSEKLKEKASKSRLLRDLQQQYDDAPEDMDAMGLGYSAKETLSKLDKELDEREEFEETNFIRLSTSKKLKKQIKNQITHRFRDEFDDLKRDFRDLRNVHNAVEEDITRKPKVGSRKAALIHNQDDKSDPPSGTAGKKRKVDFDDVDDLISGMTKSRASKDSFKAARKIHKKRK